MRFGSVCSGIEAASVAFSQHGWGAAWFAEVDIPAAGVLAHRYGATAPVHPLEGDEKKIAKAAWGDRITNWGDMTVLPQLVLDGVAEAPDVLCGGTPCQGFSLAGARKGLVDPRSQLSLHFVKLADAIDVVRARQGKPPVVIIWENVPGVLSDKGNAFGHFTAAIAGNDEPLEPGPRPEHGRASNHWTWKKATGEHIPKWTDAGAAFGPERAITWRSLDAQYFGLAQRRKRVLLVASAGAGFDPAEILLEFEGVRRDTPPRREKGQGFAADTAPCLVGSGRGAGDTRRPDGPAGLSHWDDLEGYRMVAFGEYDDDGTASTMKARDYKDATDLVVAVSDCETVFAVTGDIAHTLTGEGFDVGSKCKVADCDLEAVGKGYCKPHYSRWKRHGDPLGGRVSQGVPLTFLKSQRFALTDECIEWPYAAFKTGYPSIYIDGKNRRAHRVMCEWVHGTPEVPEHDAAHACGNRKCINPHHLRWADRASNMADAIAHGTTTRGERHGASKLTRDDVLSVFARLDHGETHQSIADSLGVHRNTITDISKGKNWGWLSEKDETVFAIQERAVSTNLENGPGGAGYSDAGVAYTLEARNKVRAVAGTTLSVRRLMPVEAERLQGFDDNHTLVPVGKQMASDGQRYKQLGNSWAVPKFGWLSGRIDSAIRGTRIITLNESEYLWLTAP